MKNQTRLLINKSVLAFFTILSIVFLLILPAGAVKNSFEASVDKTEASVQDQILLTVTATGGKPSQPDIPYSDDYELKFRGTSSEIKIINGDITASESFNYILHPRRVGEIVIPPITATIEGKEYKTKAIKIKIEKANLQQSRSNMAFVTAQVNNLEPYVNEQTTYVFRFFRKVQTTNAQLELPKFNDFWLEDMGKEKEYEQNIGGERYRVTEIKKALFPSRAGELTIPSTTFLIDIVTKIADPWSYGGFFSQTTTESKRYVTNPLKIKVKPLPGNPPAGFNNLIGSHLQLDTKIGQNKLKAGESLTYNLTLQGESNFHDFEHPPLKLADDIKIYQDQPLEKTTLKQNQIYMEKTFKYALVPLYGGKLQLPSLEVPYFDTKQKKYIILKSQAYTLQVEGPANPNKNKSVKPSPVNTITKPDKTGEDIFTIHTSLDSLQKQNINSVQKVLMLICFLLPLLLWLLISFLLKGKLKELKEKYSNKQKYFDDALIRLNKLARAGDKSQSDFSAEFTMILKDYLSHKYALNQQVLDSDFVEKRLAATNLSGELIQELKTLLEKSETLKFSPENFAGEQKEEIINRTKTLLQKVEAVK